MSESSQAEREQDAVAAMVRIFLDLALSMREEYSWRAHGAMVLATMRGSDGKERTMAGRLLPRTGERPTAWMPFQMLKVTSGPPAGPGRSAGSAASAPSPPPAHPPSSSAPAP